MALTNYGELKTSVKRLLSRSDTLDAELDDFTVAYEARANRLIRSPEQIIAATITTTNGVASLPVDYLKMHNVVVVQSGRPLAIEPVTSQYLAAKDGNDGSAVRMYAIIGEELHTVGKGDVDIDIVYYQRIPTITDGDTDTNWLLQNWPDLYLYGVALEAAIFMQDDKRMKVYGSRLELGMTELKAYVKQHRYGDSAPIGRSF